MTSKKNIKHILQFAGSPTPVQRDDEEFDDFVRRFEDYAYYKERREERKGRHWGEGDGERDSKAQERGNQGFSDMGGRRGKGAFTRQQDQERIDEDEALRKQDKAEKKPTMRPRAPRNQPLKNVDKTEDELARLRKIDEFNEAVYSKASKMDPGDRQGYLNNLLIGSDQANSITDTQLRQLIDDEELSSFFSKVSRPKIQKNAKSKSTISKKTKKSSSKSTSKKSKTKAPVSKSASKKSKTKKSGSKSKTKKSGSKSKTEKSGSKSKGK